MALSLRLAVNHLLDVAFPPTCAACGQAADGLTVAGDFCPACEADLELFAETVCPRCSTPTPIADPGAKDCPACREERWGFDATIALGPYDGLLRRLVLDAKCPEGEPGAAALGRMLGRRHRGTLLALEPVCVAAVPSHWSRRMATRCDGPAAIGRALAAEIGVPFARRLRRTRATPRQTSVAPSDRVANVRRAFSVHRANGVAGRTVLLVDDVLTTGGTCSAAARALKRAGATRVAAVVAARRLGSL